MVAKPKRVLCIMDLSCVGRASLGVVTPVLAACGVQACPLPTAIFSTHTMGFGSPIKQNTVEFCEQALEHYKNNNLVFDAIYVGYLYGKPQFNIANKAFTYWPNAFKMVDPAMADDGKLYPGMTDDDVKEMKYLCSQANMITPNITESQLLCNQTIQKDFPPQNLPAILSQLCTPKTIAIITSAPSTQNNSCVAYASKQQDGILEYAVQDTQLVPKHYPGTGDLFASALLGLILQKAPLPLAVEQATHFVLNAVQDTYQHNGTPKQGVWYEPQLYLLIQAIQKIV